MQFYLSGGSTTRAITNHEKKRLLVVRELQLHLALLQKVTQVCNHFFIH